MNQKIMNSVFLFVCVVLFSQILFSAVPPILWSNTDLKAPSFGSASVGDIDGDGKLEVVFGTYFGDENVYVLNGEDGTVLWKFYGGGGPLDASTTIANINNDGKMEVLVAASWGILWALDGRGEVIWRYPVSDYTECIDSPSAVADVNGDGKPEVIFGQWSGFITVLNGSDGTVVWRKNIGEDNYIQSQPAILDVDGDGGLDIVVSTFYGDNKVYALRGKDGQILWTFQAGDEMYFGPTFADIDEDGKDELVIASYDGYVYVLNAEDGLLNWKYYTGEVMFGPSSIADLNNDGHLEIVAPGNSIFVLSHTGSLLWNCPTGDIVFRGAAIADVDGDGVLDVAFGSVDHTLRVLKGSDGSEIWKWDLGGDNEIDHAPVIADLDGDGKLELFFVAGYYESPNNHGQAYALKTGAGTGPGWPMFAHDLKHSGCLITNNNLILTLSATPTSGVTPLEVSFNSEVSGGTTPYIYDWDFKDGSPHGDSSSLSHIFTSPGNYNVSLTVKDFNGLIATSSIQISAIPFVEPPVISDIDKASNPFKLIVYGSNFLKEGEWWAGVYINDVSVPHTVYKSSEKLVAIGGKNLKKMVPKGVTVQVKVRNPDGTMSEPFPFKR